MIIELVILSFVLTNVTYLSTYVDINRNNGLSGLFKATTTIHHQWIENLVTQLCTKIIAMVIHLGLMSKTSEFPIDVLEI